MAIYSIPAPSSPVTLTQLFDRLTVEQRDALLAMEHGTRAERHAWACWSATGVVDLSSPTSREGAAAVVAAHSELADIFTQMAGAPLPPVLEPGPNS